LHQIKRSYHILLLVMLIIERLLLPAIATPTFADSPTVNGTITTGTLTESATGTYSFSGTPGSTVTFTMPFLVYDMTGGAVGWNITITSTQFTSGNHTLPVTALTVTGTSGACTLGGSAGVNCMQSPTLTNTIVAPVAIPAATGTAPTAVRFFAIAAASASGIYTITPTISVTIPAFTFIATYTSVITLSIMPGP
jgi:hypothetical protein